MQIVIDILEEDYEEILKDNSDGSPLENILSDAVREGTVLPLNHGRLIDADKLNTWWTAPDRSYRIIEVISRCDIDKAPTILEADKANI